MERPAATHDVLVYYLIAWHEVIAMSTSFALKGRVVDNDWSTIVIEFARAFQMAHNGTLKATNLLALQTLNRLEHTEHLVIEPSQREPLITHLAQRLYVFALLGAEPAEESHLIPRHLIPPYVHDQKCGQPYALTPPYRPDGQPNLNSLNRGAS